VPPSLRRAVAKGFHKPRRRDLKMESLALVLAVIDLFWWLRK
jgi:hypothetical protein